MADYATQTCFALAWPREAREELRQALEVINDLATEMPPGKALQSKIDALSPTVRRIVERVAESYDTVGMAVIHDDEDGMLVADEDGMFAPTMAADLLQAVMQVHHIEEPVVVSYAEVCSKHRRGAFSGGGFVVTKDDIRFEHIADILAAIEQDMVPDTTCKP